MALEGELFRVRCASEVRQAPGHGSPLLYTAGVGQLVKRIGLPVQLADGTHRVPVLPRGWVNAEALDPIAVDEVVDRCSPREIETLQVRSVGSPEEPEEIQPMPGAQASSAEPCNWQELLGDNRNLRASSAEPCNWLELLGDSRDLRTSSAEPCNWLRLLADDRNIGRPGTTHAVQGSNHLKPRCATSSTAPQAVTDGWSLWREPLTKVPPGRQVHLPGVLRSDAGLRQWFDTEGTRHLERLGPGPLDCMDLSHNCLSDQGADDAVSFLLWRGQQTKRLKLFHNYLLEPLALCRLIEDERCGVGAVDGIRELHLSHNQMKISVLERLLSSVATRLDNMDKEARPWRPPLWLRVEHNDLDGEATDLLKETCSGVKLCFDCGVKSSRQCRSQGCTLTHCKNGADVHLGLIMKAGSTEGKR